MKKILLLVLISINTYAYSQTLINKKDDFTGKQLKEAVVIFGKTLSPVPMSLIFSDDNGTKYIIFTWTANSGPFGAFKNAQTSKMSLLFKMADTLLRFQADTTLSSINNVGNSSMMAVASKITDQELLYLASHKILKFRVGMRDDSGVDLDDHYIFTDRNKNQVQRAAAYMLDMQVLATD